MKFSEDVNAVMRGEGEGEEGEGSSWIRCDHLFRVERCLRIIDIQAAVTVL